MENGGFTLHNPYASVNIPRTQLENSFIKRILGEELPPPTVLANPGAVPTYPASELLNGASRPVGLASWDDSKVTPQGSVAQLYNPYASLDRTDGMSPEQLYAFELDKHKSAEGGLDRACPCCKYCPCCRKCSACCIVS